MQDFPDIFRGEEWIFAILLTVIMEACSTMNEGELKSWGRAAYARALHSLAQAGFVEITSAPGADVAARVTPLGATLIERLHADEKKTAAAADAIQGA